MTDLIERFIVVFGIVLTAGFTLLIPGGVLSYALFPKGALDWIERLFIATLTSIILSSLVCFVLLKTSVGLRPLPFLGTIVLLVCALGAVALVRQRKEVQGSYNLAVNVSSTVSSLRAFLPKTLSLLLVGVIASALSFFLTTRMPFAITEFYISPDFLAQLQDGDVYSSGRVRLPVEIVNREGKRMKYRVEMWVSGEKVWAEEDIVVENQATSRLVIEGKLNANSRFLDILLLNADEERLEANLRIWLNQK